MHLYFRDVFKTKENNKDVFEKVKELRSKLQEMKGEHDMKKLTVLLMAFLLVLTACGNTGKEQGKEQAKGQGEEVKIGLLAPLSGPVAEYGVASSNGTKLAFDVLNGKNYLDGKVLTPVAYDDESDQTKAVNLFNKLISNDKIVALVGAVTSKPSLAVAPVANEEKIPMITPTGTHLDITPDYEYVFRACFIDPYQGQLAGQFAVQNLGVKKVAVVYNVGSDYSVGLAEEFTKAVKEAGLEVTNNEGYNDDDKDFSALAAKLKASAPELVFVPDYYNKVGTIVGQFKAAGVDAKYLGGDGWDGVLANFAKEAEGCYYLTHFSVNDPSNTTSEFVTAFKDKYGVEPSSFAALGYDAGLVIAEAVKKAGSTKSEDLMNAMKNIELQGVTGTIRFDENGNPNNKDVTVIKVVDGKPTIETKIKAK